MSQGTRDENSGGMNQRFLMGRMQYRDGFLLSAILPTHTLAVQGRKPEPVPHQLRGGGWCGTPADET